jgi:hypothetical protein
VALIHAVAQDRYIGRNHYYDNYFWICLVLRAWIFGSILSDWCDVFISDYFYNRLDYWVAAAQVEGLVHGPKKLIPSGWRKLRLSGW